jgi:hypothetical protein
MWRDFQKPGYFGLLQNLMLTFDKTPYASSLLLTILE